MNEQDTLFWLVQVQNCGAKVQKFTDTVHISFKDDGFTVPLADAGYCFRAMVMFRGAGAEKVKSSVRQLLHDLPL